MLLFCLLFPAIGVAESIAVVVNPLSGVAKLTRSDVINIYMGRQKKLGINHTALPVDLAGSNRIKQAFYIQLLDKQLAEINSYWARLIFSGQGSPPRQLESVNEIIQTVRDNPGAIGYVPATENTHGLVVVYILQEE